MSEALTPTQLVDVVRADRRRRWAAGHRVLAEAYLEQYPDLEANPTLAVELIYHEVLLREELGEAFSLDEYLRRFPRLVPQLEPLFEVHRAIEAGEANASTPSLNRSLQHTPPHSERGDAPLPVVPGYDVLGRLGRGGMGVVYRARHQRLDRVVALKMLLTGTEAETGELARFRAEAEAQARLQHPNIVQIFEVGETNGCPYFALEYIEGGSLEQKCRGTPQPPLAAARLVETVARAVHHAHQRGLVHRDLKPANILLTAEGAPKVSDFGLAKRLTGGDGASTEAGNSRSQDLVGTPSYMAPEQAAAKREMIGPAADVYALGAILYELLTGRPPFLAETALDTLLQVRSLDPVPVRRLQPQVARDLETVCLKCLRKEPAKRYATAEALADDLRRYQEGQPVAARPVGWWERGAKWAKRRPAVAGLLLALALVISGSLVGLTWLWLNAQEQRARAEYHLEEARAAGATAKAINRFLVEDLLAVARPEGQGRQVTIREALDAVLPKIESAFQDQPEVEASVRHALGVTYHRLALHAQAEPQLRRALDLNREHLGPEHPDTLTTVHDLADLLHSQGRLAEAEAMLCQNQEARLRVLGPEHSDTLASVNNLALVLRDRGKLAEAEALFRQNLANSSSFLGSNDLRTLTAAANLAQVLHHQGKLDEAESFYRQTLEADRLALGPDHPSTLIAVNNLAALLRDRGKLDVAEALLRQNLEAVRRVQGADHPETLGTVNNLAALLRAQGKLDEAEALYRKNLADVRRALGPDHPITLETVNGLARLLREQGRLKEAEPFCRESVEDHRRALGPDHHDTLKAMSNLAALLRAQGKLDEAEPLYRQSLEGVRRVLGAAAPDTLVAENNLALLLADQGKRDEAEELLRRNLETRRRVLAPSHPNTLAAVNNLAMQLRDNRKLAEAEVLLRQNLKDRQNVLGPKHPDTIQAINNLALALQDLGQLAEAEQFFREAVQLQRGLPEKSRFRITYSLVGLGVILLQTSRAQEAEPLLRECLEIRRRDLPNGHRLSAQAEGELGSCLVALGRYAEAEPLLLSCYETLRPLPGVSASAVGVALDRLIKLYAAWEKPEKAAEWRAARDKLPLPAAPAAK